MFMFVKRKVLLLHLRRETVLWGHLLLSYMLAYACICYLTGSVCYRTLYRTGGMMRFGRFVWSLWGEYILVVADVSILPILVEKEEALLGQGQGQGS